MLLVGDRERAVFLVVDDLLFAVEGQAVFHVALYPVDGEDFIRMEDGFEYSRERAG